MRISQIRLENWMNFQKADVKLQSRVFLVGPNASGKSNFLDALCFLRDIAPEGIGFKRACEQRGGVSRIRCLAARRNPNIAVEVELTEREERTWSYRIAFGQDNNRNPIIKQEVVSKGGDVILTRPDTTEKKDTLRLSQAALGQPSLNEKFRPLAQFFDDIVYMHLVPQIVRHGGDLHIEGDSFAPYGWQFLHRIANMREKWRKPRMERIERVLRSAVPQLKQLRLEMGSDDRTPHLVATYEHWRAQGAKQTERQFSDGTLHLFGLLWAVLDARGPVLLEEPELSLHTSVVRRLAPLVYELQKGRKQQVFVSTHSLDLLSHKGIGGEEVLLLEPSEEGTVVKVASDIQEICDLLEQGIPVSDVVIPRTEPSDVLQLDLFKV